MDERLQQARNHTLEGMNALQAGNGQAANTAFLSAIELGWPGPDVWITLSFAKSQLGDMAGRIGALEKALEIDPSSVRARLHYGQALAGSGRVEAAKAAFRKGLQGIRHAPRNAEIDQLIKAANSFLGDEAKPAEPSHPLADFAREHAVGSHPDDALFAQSLDFLMGRSVPYASRPTRYLYPGLPNRQFYPAADFDWAGPLAAKTEEIRAELQSLLERQTAEPNQFAPYVEAGGREGETVSHPLLDNPDWGAFYLVKQGERQDANIALCPKTMAAIDAIGADAAPAPATSVLFSLLRPGASIPPHHGMLNTRLICHLPLILPGQCGFRVGNETREWKDGELFIFDDTIEHEAWNHSDRPRYVLIFEIWHPDLTARQRELISKLFALAAPNEAS